MPTPRLLALLVVLLIPMAARAAPATAEPADRSDPDPAIELDGEADPSCPAANSADGVTDRPAGSEAVRLASLITFRPGRVRVYAKDREKLMVLAHAWQHHPQWGHITIEGFDRDPGNLVLAQRRADKIRNYLIRYGVAAEDITAVGRARPPGDAPDPRAIAGGTDVTIARCDQTSARCRASPGAAVSSRE